MTAPRTSLSVLGAIIAAGVAGGVLGAAPAGAQPAAPPIPRGMPQIVSDVLGPRDPGFWNPAVAGTRVLTPIEPGVEVACATGFDPVISCSRVKRSGLPAQRQLGFVDVPTFSGPGIRVWFDYPRWGDGSTGEVNRRVLEELQARRQ